MEPKNNLETAFPHPIIRIIKLGLLGLTLIIFAFKYEHLNCYLLQCHPFLLDGLWVWMVKVISYGAQIVIDYFILLVLTRNHKYPRLMAYTSVILMAVGFLIVISGHFLKQPFSLELSSFFVKLVKSQILLILFVAAYIVDGIYKPKFSE